MEMITIYSAKLNLRILMGEKPFIDVDGGYMELMREIVRGHRHLAPRLPESRPAKIDSACSSTWYLEEYLVYETDRICP